MNEENGEDVQQDAAMFLRLRFTARLRRKPREPVQVFVPGGGTASLQNPVGGHAETRTSSCNSSINARLKRRQS